MRVLALAAAGLFSSCAPAPDCCSGDGAAGEQGVVEAVMGMYQAFQQRNLEKVGGFMTEGSTCYDATTSRLLTGRKAVLDHFGAILAEHKDGERWESAIEGMKVALSNDLACATYQVRTSAGGLHTLAAVSHVFRKVDGRWLAVHLHRSWNLK